MNQLGPTLAEGDIPGFGIVTGPLITSDHRGFVVAEADDDESVRRFTVESRLIQCNAVTTIPVISYRDALEELNTVTPVWP